MSSTLKIPVKEAKKYPSSFLLILKLIMQYSLIDEFYSLYDNWKFDKFSVLLLINISWKTCM